MSRSRTIAVPSLAARTMMASNSSGLVSSPCAVTTNVCCVPGTAGWPPIWPMPNVWLWLWIACATSPTVMPSCAMRSGCSHTRIAMSGRPMTDARLAPGTRLSSSSTYRFV